MGKCGAGTYAALRARMPDCTNSIASQLSHRRGYASSPHHRRQNVETKPLLKSLQEILLTKDNPSITNHLRTTFQPAMPPRTPPPAIPPLPHPKAQCRRRPRPRPKLRLYPRPASEDGTRRQTTRTRPHHPRHHTRNRLHTWVLAGATARLENRFGRAI